ncbi:putative 4-coumarate--CoA ligase 2 [Cercospora beticola]|nr:putative 4-coumarate--CoA ligase 2 [Cercospora beticola]PIA92419.1 putative 4-coumarate--CoA ligase 2 [Cercospora beticola]
MGRRYSAHLGSRGSQKPNPFPTMNINNTGEMPACTVGSANVVQFAFSGDYNPRQPVLIDAENPARFITKECALQLTASLTGAFPRNSTVCLAIPNDITYPVICMGIWTSQCRWTGVNPAYSTPELKHHFTVSETKYVIAGEEQLEKVRKAVQDTNIEIILFSDLLESRPAKGQEVCAVRPNPRDDTVPHRYRCLHELQRTTTAARFYDAIDAIDPNSIASLFSTSGTTGLPKMAARPHKSLVLEAAATKDNHEAKPYQVRRLFCTPIFHAFSTGEMVINSLRLGQPTYYMKRFHPSAFPKAIEDYNITETFAPPPLILKLVEDSRSHSQIQSLRNIYSGGAPLVPELKSRLDAIYDNNPSGPPRVTQVYGMTEGGWFTTFKYDEHDTTNSIGRPIKGYEIRVVNREGFKSFEGRQTGELLVRGPMLMTKYLGNQQATVDAFEDSWLKTGDVGYIVDGKVYLVDRCKDLIKVNGFQVSPTELENALLSSPDIADVGVVGHGSDTNEHPVAFVVGANPQVTPEEIKLRLRNQLASYKVSTLEVKFVESLPKSITGKILRTELRKLCC